MLVATDADSEEAELNLELARHFAREKQLPLLACEVGDGARVKEVFCQLVERVMECKDQEREEKCEGGGKGRWGEREVKREGECEKREGEIIRRGRL